MSNWKMKVSNLDDVAEVDEAIEKFMNREISGKELRKVLTNYRDEEYAEQRFKQIKEVRKQMYKTPIAPENQPKTVEQLKREIIEKARKEKEEQDEDDAKFEGYDRLRHQMIAYEDGFLGDDEFRQILIDFYGSVEKGEEQFKYFFDEKQRKEREKSTKKVDIDDKDELDKENKVKDGKDDKVKDEKTPHNPKLKHPTLNKTYEELFFEYGKKLAEAYYSPDNKIEDFNEFVEKYQKEHNDEFKNYKIQETRDYYRKKMEGVGTDITDEGGDDKDKDTTKTKTNIEVKPSGEQTDKETDEDVDTEMAEARARNRGDATAQQDIKKNSKGEKNAQDKGKNLPEKGQPFKMKRTLSKANIDELFKNTIDYCVDAYNETPTLPNTVPVIRQATVDLFGFFTTDSVFPVNVIKRQNRLYIAVRGSTTTGNWITNFIGALPAESLENSNFANIQNIVSRKAFLTKFHGGFLKEVNETYRILRGVIDMYYGSVNKLVWTGHSAGSPIASIYAYIYHFDLMDQDKKIETEYVITYASPRFVMDEITSVKNFNSVFSDNYIRCFKTNDPVPYLPFKDPKLDIYGLDGINMGEGYIHIGTSFCLDSDLVNNDPNVLLDVVLTKDKPTIVNLLRDNPSMITSYFLQNLLNPNILRLVLNNVCYCAITKKMKRNFSQYDIMMLSEVVKEKSKTLKTWAEKCDLLKPMRIADRLKVEPLFNKSPLNPQIKDELKKFQEIDKTSYDAQDSFIGFMSSVAYQSGMLMINEHLQEPYQEAVNKLIDLEAEGKGGFMSIPSRYFKFKIDRQQVREDIVKQAVVRDIENKKDYLAIVEMDENLKYGELVEVYE